MTPNIATRMKADAIFLHPLPRKLEMGTENDHLILDQDPRFIYNEQMRNGMFVRMAMLDLVLNGNAN
jgi:aspartate carbamoyltransferase catalytic subunit